MEKELRKGFTTGSCSAAASKAAAFMLLSGRRRDKISIETPGGPVFCALLTDIERHSNWVQCAVIKDGGDDPDVTTGLHVTSRVSIEQEWEEPESSSAKEDEPDAITGVERDNMDGIASDSLRIFIDGGLGVGRVTLPGLDQPVGNAAINRVPRMMIEKEVREVAEAFDFHGTLRVIISVPEGDAVAKVTFNPKLGIVGGISILGTTGIVEPMSTQAILDTIEVELRQWHALGYSVAVVAPGNYGVKFMQDHYGYDLDQSVKCSNFIGDTIDRARALDFRGLLLTGHIGKLIKVSGGMMNTHSRQGDARMELLAAALLRVGGPGKLALDVLDCAVTEEALKRIREESPELFRRTMDELMARICYYLRKRAGDEMQVECILYSMEHGLLAESKGAEAMLREMQSGDVRNESLQNGTTGIT